MNARIKYLKQFEARRAKVRRMLESGMTRAEVARAMNVSRQRIHAIVKRESAK